MNAEKSPENHNVDHEEIAKFEAVASRWWDLEGEFKPLHRINPLRLGYIAERAGGLFGKKVLDVGCGGGILAESMAREGATVTGLDMGFEPLQVAKLHALESGIPVQNAIFIISIAYFSTAKKALAGKMEKKAAGSGKSRETELGA